ncbi:hypothetical protein RQP46_009438 [Phenoliferia psychrophenolica]
MTVGPLSDYFSRATWELIESKVSDEAKVIITKLLKFVVEDCIPAEERFHLQISEDPKARWASYPTVIEELKDKAKSLGLFNLFLSREHYAEGSPLTNLEYAVAAEIMGRSIKVAPEACNCSAPDTGNMEVLARYGTDAQKAKWLVPLLAGKTRSSFAMTEPKISSSDATNIKTSMRIEGDEVVINGSKWWISGAGDPRNAIHLVMGKTDPTAEKYQQQTVVLIPSDAPGVKLIRPMKIFGYDDAPEGHLEVSYENVRVPLSNVVGGVGRGFEIIQGRLGPGRLHHCMRLIGMAERGLDLMILRATDPEKVAFGNQLQSHGTVVQGIAKCRIEIDSARLLVLTAALAIDLHKSKGAMKEIGMAKALVPKLVSGVLDRALQLHGAEGLSQDTPIALFWSIARWLRFADEVHLAQIGKNELKRAAVLRSRAIKAHL